MSATPPLPTPPPLPPELRAKLLAAVQKEPSQKRTTVRAVTLVLFVLAAAAIVWFWQRPMDAVHLFDRIVPIHPDPIDPMNRPDMKGGFSAFRRYEGTPDYWVRVAIAIGASAISAAVSVIAFARGKSMVGRRGSILVAVVFLTPAALMLWKWGLSGAVKGGWDWDKYREGYRCLKISLCMGVVPLAAALYLRKASDPLHPLTTGAALGVATGAITWSFVDLTCNVGNWMHLVLGHLLPIVTFAVVGALIGHLLLRIRAR